MAESLRELVVKLTMDSGSFATEQKAVNTAVKQAEANFKQAGAGVKGFENTLAGARAKVEMLTDKLTAQNQAVTNQKAQLEKNNQALAKNQQQRESLAQKIESAKKAYDTESAATGKSSAASLALADDLKKLEGQQKSLEKQATRQATAITGSELALTKASTAAKETEAALKIANAEVSKGSSMWTKFGASADKAQKVLGSAGKKMSSAGQKITMGLTLPIIAAGAAALKAFDTFDDGVDTIIRKTGASGPQLESLEKSFTAVFTGMKTTAADAGIAVGEVNTRFALTGTALEELSSTFIQFANINETELNGSIGKTQKILSQWGLGSEDATGFLGLLTSESQRTGLSVDALFTSIQANGATLKGMGLNLSQSVQMMANFEVAGINADTAMAALKKSVVEYTKEGKTLEAGLAGTITSIQGAKTETEALAIAQKVFGAKGALEMATAIREGRLSVTGLTADMTQMGDVVSSTFNGIENDTPVLDRVKNKLVATGAQFGKSMLPWIEQAAGKLGSLVDKFGEMDPAMQKNVLVVGALAAGIGPLLSGLGKVATGASAVSKGMSSLSTLMGGMTGPAGWIALASVALVGLGVYLSTLPTDAEKAAEILDGIKFDVKIGDQAGITTAINAGISAANKVHTIKISVEADIAKLQEELDKLLADDKLTRKESNYFKNLVKDMIEPDINAAKEELAKKRLEYQAEIDAMVDYSGKPLTAEQKKKALAAFDELNKAAIAEIETQKKELIKKRDEYKKELNTAVGVDGKPLSKEEKEQRLKDYNAIHNAAIEVLDTQKTDLITSREAYKAELDTAIDYAGSPIDKEQKAALMAEFDEKNGEIVKQMEAGMAEVNRLLAIITAAGSNYTQDMVDDLMVAIEKVSEFRVLIQEAQDAAVQAAKADYNLTITGGGNDTSAANAAGYVAQTKANEIAAAEETKQKALAASANNATAAAAAYVAYDESVAAANTKAQAGFEAIAGGMSKGSEGAQGLITDLALVSDQLKILEESAKNFDPDQYNLAIKALFGEGGELSKYVPENFWDTFFANSNSDDPGNQAYAANMAEDMVGKVKIKIAEEIAAVADDPSLNLMNQLLKTFTDAGAWDAIDPTTVQGPLLAMLQLVDLSSGGKLLGENVTEGIKLGVNSGAASSFTKSELAPVKTALENGIKAVLEIRSPSKVMIPLGEQITAGLAAGIIKNTGALTDSIKKIYAAGMAEANKQEIILRNHLAWLASTRGGGEAQKPAGNTNITNYGDSDISVNAIIQNEADAKVLAAQLEGINRRRLAGYGTT